MSAPVETGWPGWWLLRRPLDLVLYVEEDQEAQGADASQQGEPRQAPQHGSLNTLV